MGFHRCRLARATKIKPCAGTRYNANVAAADGVQGGRLNGEAREWDYLLGSAPMELVAFSSCERTVE
jgi:hypothetical protein